MKLLARSMVLASSLALLAASSQAQIVSVSATYSPPNPTTQDAVELLVDIFSSISPAFVLTASHAIDPPVAGLPTPIRVDLVVNPGSFAVPSGIIHTETLGALPPGAYLTEIWIEEIFNGSSLGPPTLRALAPFDVADAGPLATPIPTLGQYGMALLVALLALAGGALLRRRSVVRGAEQRAPR